VTKLIAMNASVPDLAKAKSPYSLKAIIWSKKFGQHLGIFKSD
jgi:hypothetical protein